MAEQMYPSSVPFSSIYLSPPQHGTVLHVRLRGREDSVLDISDCLAFRSGRALPIGRTPSNSHITRLRDGIKPLSLVAVD